MMNNIIPQYGTKKFTDFYPNLESFRHDYETIGIPTTISNESITVLYYLLYAEYGNSIIANSDENQFKYRVFSTIFQYGPVWERKLEIQDKLINLPESDILQGSKAIYNAALNPSTAPTTEGTDELPYINEQNTTKYKKPVLEGYTNLWMILRTDVTSSFLKRFEKIFLRIVMPQNPVLYISDDDDEEGDVEL